MNKSIKSTALTLAAIAILALPIRASANDRYGHDGDDRAYHDRGLHRGWYKHDRAGDRDTGRFGHDRADQRFFRDRDGDHRRRDANYGADSQGHGYYARSNPAGSSVATVGNQLATGYSNLQAAYSAAVARGDNKGAKHYLNAIRAQQKQIAAFNTTWGNSGAFIPINGGLPTNYYAPLNY